jgi:hypothetical protein
MEIMMKIINSFILIFLSIVFLSACNPIPTFEQLEKSNKVDQTRVSEITPSENSITISFEPVLGADAYHFILTNEETKQKTQFTKTINELDKQNCFHENCFTYTIEAVSVHTKYNIEIFAIKGNIHSKTTITTSTKNLSQDNLISPFVKLVKRSENSAELQISNIDGISYFKIKVGDNPIISKLKNNSDSTILILNNLEQNEEYLVKIYSALESNKDTINDNEKFTSMKISKFIAIDNDLIPTIVNSKFTLGDGWYTQNETSFTVNINNSLSTNEKAQLSIYYSTDDRLNFTLFNYTPIEENKKTYQISKEFSEKENLCYEYYAVVEYLVENNEIIKKSPNSEIFNKSSIKSYVFSTINNIKINWDSIENISYYSIKQVNSNGEIIQELNQNQYLMKSDDKTVFTFDDIQKDTTYYFLIEGTLKNGKKFILNNGIIEATSKSFEGKYEWSSKTKGDKTFSFVVDVKNNPNFPQNSIFPYYISINEEDSQWDGSSHRIMPLIDSKELSKDFIDLNYDSNFARAYKWNEKKWNTTEMHPSGWKVSGISTDEKIKLGIYSTIVTSKTAFFDVQTLTKFQLREKNGMQELIFVNKGYGTYAQLVDVGVFVNPSPEEGYDKYTFILKKMEF